VRNVVLGYLFW